MKIIYKTKQNPEVSNTINEVVDVTSDVVGNVWVIYKLGETNCLTMLNINSLEEITIYDIPESDLR